VGGSFIRDIKHLRGAPFVQELLGKMARNRIKPRGQVSFREGGLNYISTEFTAAKKEKVGPGTKVPSGEGGEL